MISTLTASVSVPDPRLAHFGVGIDAWPSAFHTILTHLQVAARLAIAQNVKIYALPTLYSMIQILNEQAHLEYLFAKAHLSQNTFLCQWAPWLNNPNCSL